MNVTVINAWTLAEAGEAFRRCCGSTRWAHEMERLRPFDSDEAVLEAADRIWWALEASDWREAFAAHPKIGARGATGPHHAATAGWSKAEQSGAERASAEVLENLAEMNRRYEARFGFIFIVCATGKSAEEMLGAIASRMRNEPNDEIRCAALEQAKITRIRLEKIAP
jgi:2-oxo-4-hydroxy-4-carboxy-5-ureidoimidazoline decarboxylase